MFHMIEDIVKIGASRWKHSPCVISSSVDDANASTDQSLAISYDAFLEVLKKHQTILQSILETIDQQYVVAYLAANDPDLILSVLACTSTNAAPALINTRWSVHEIADVLESMDSRSVTIIFHDNFHRSKAEEVARHLSHATYTFEIQRYAQGAMAAISASFSVPTKPIPNVYVRRCIEQLRYTSCGKEDALLVFTSGTTSGSKGVRLSHRAILVQALAKLEDPCQYNNESRVLATTIPFFHVGGLSSLLAVLIAGGAMVFPKSTASFDPLIVSRSIQCRCMAVNTLVVVPAMLFAMQEQDQTQIYKSVRLILIGGQSASSAMRDYLRRSFPNARLVQTYACSEAASSLTFYDITNDDSGEMIHPPVSGDCVGRPPSHVDLKLLQNGQPITSLYTPGIIATKGPHVMNGYWRRKDPKAYATIPSDEWLSTNDLGFWDERGYLNFCGRANDVIRTGGETVLANEVERIIQDHPAIKECAIFALPDDRYGESVCCALVVSPLLKRPRLSELRQWCEERGLAGFKRPRRLFFLDQLPKNSSGKVLKFRLRERFGSDFKMQSRL